MSVNTEALVVASIIGSLCYAAARAVDWAGQFLGLLP